MTKTCTKCGEAKPLGAYGKNGSGLRAACKLCVNAAQLARKAADPAKYREIGRRSTAKRRAEEPERNREVQQRANVKFRAAHRERLTAWQRAYYLTPEGRDSAYRSVAARRARERGAAHAPYSRTAIFAAYGGTCAYCGDPAEHLDHVVPISKGGPDAAHNLLPACAPCNLSKSAKSLAEWALTWL